ncbi:MBG domain-containing protein [Novosphingobium piscinae]|uniref:Autotransporter-associated beta strand repeat-containing protein n=1 Tax=Novosphingobium piscinae TaxID=1507448 RepID=A0A7X1KPL7_9SPHN|nr:autotransporter-associated beta strand repeat-containing protein [Novosphingobium piscinae]
MRADEFLPTGGAVTAGQAAISAAGRTLTIDQGSSRAVIAWDSFSVGAGASVRFNAPDASAATLNRVSSSAPSVIAGQISGNGQVFLINPNGIALTSTGTVDTTGGFVASTLDLTDRDFLAGSLRFAGDRAGEVHSAGRITVGEGGFTALLGARVSQTGTIRAPLGRIGLGAGAAATLDLGGDQFLQVTLPSHAMGGDSLLTADGHIAADRIELRAADAAELVRNTVNLTGTLRATGARAEGGTIVIEGGDGDLRLAGTLDATSATGRGGTIDVGGATLALIGASVTASGATGGGTVRLGGDIAGAVRAGLTTAQRLTMDASSTVRADATAGGDGGTVVLWSDGTTHLSGQVSADALGPTGNGGFIETSALGQIGFGSAFAASAAARGGDGGTWLIDPQDLTIDATGAAAISASLNGGTSVTATTTACNASFGTCSGTAGDITLAAPITKTAGGNATLTLTATRDILLNADVSSSSNQLNLTLNAGGAISGSGAINANGGLLTANVGAGSGTLSGAITGTTRLTKQGAGTLVLAGANTFSGATTLSAGTLRAGSTTAFGSNSAVTMSSGTSLDLAGSAVSIGSLAGSGTVTNSQATAATLTVGGANVTTTFAGQLQDGAGALALTKIGLGLLLLTGTNTYSGLTTISGGLLRIGDGQTSGTLGSGAVLNNANLRFQRSDAVTIGNAISGTGTVTNAGAGTLTLTGNNSYTGATSAINGNLRAGSATAFGSNSALSISAGRTVDLAGFSVTFGSLSGSGVVTSSAASSVTLTVGGLNATTIYSGVIEDGAGQLALTKVGTGALALSGANTYTGQTTISAGILRIGANGTTGSLGNTAIVNNASLQFQRTNALTFGNAISGTGSVGSIATGTITLTGNNSYTGATAVTSGSFVAGSATAFGSGSAVTISSGRSLDLAGFPITIGSLAGAGRVTNSGASPVTLTVGSNDTSTTFSGVLENGTSALALTKVGTGTLTLSGRNTHSGPITIDSGTLTFSGNGTSLSAGTIQVNSGGILGFGRNDTWGDDTTTSSAAIIVNAGGEIRSNGYYNRLWNLTLNGGTLNANGGATPVWGSFGLSGTVTVNATSSILASGSNSQILLGGSSNQTTTFAIVPGARLTSQAAFNDYGYAAGSGLTLTGGGTLQLGARNSHTGTISVFAGVLELLGCWCVGSGIAQTHVAGGASLFSSGGLDAGTLSHSGTGELVALSGIDRFVTTSPVGNVTLLNWGSLSLGSIDSTGVLTLQAGFNGEADLSLEPGAMLTSTASGTAIRLGAERNFLNDAGPNALSTPNGRWQVFTSSPDTARFGGLDSGNTAIWNRSWVAANTPVSQPGNRYVFGAQPTLDFNTVDLHKTYGFDATPILDTVTEVTGYHPGVAGAFLGDTAASAWSGAPLLGSAGAEATASVDGGPYAISLAQGTVSGLNGYAVRFASTGRVFVAPKALTLTYTANPASSVYGDPLAALDGTVTGSGFVNGEGLAQLGGALTWSSPVSQGSGVGAYEVTGSGLTSSNYVISAVQDPSNAAAYTVTPAPLTITGATTRATYSGRTQDNGFSVTGLIGNDSVTGVAGLARGIDAGTYRDSLRDATGAGLANYTIRYVDGSLTIDPAPLTLTYAAALRSSLYGSPLAALDGTVTGSGFVNGEGLAQLSGMVGWSTTATAGAGAGVYGISGSGLTSRNYAITARQADGNAGAYRITPAPLTITVRDAAKTYDGFGWSGGNGVMIDGLVNGDTPASLTGMLRYTGNAQGAVHPGTYRLGADGLTSPNYVIDWTAGTLTIESLKLTTWPSPIVGPAPVAPSVAADPLPLTTIVPSAGCAAGSSPLGRDPGPGAGGSCSQR